MNCYLVKDLLPNYIDGLVSEETERDMGEHLENCPECHLLYEQMKAPIAPAPVQTDGKEINFLKKIRAKTMKTIAISAAAIIVIFGVLAWIYAIGTAANSKDVAVVTEFQYADEAYLNRVWVIHFKITNGKALNVKNKYTYENGTKITGCIITLYEVQPSALIFESDNYTFGYSRHGAEVPASDFDYTVTVRYKDKDVVYTMKGEGLFAVK